MRGPDERLIGNVAIEVELDGEKRVLAGFENHGGRTYLGPDANPLGRVLKGHGNDGHSGFEGARFDNTIGTYLHGPLLPKNAWFADWLIARSLGGDVDSLAALDDVLRRTLIEVPAEPRGSRRRRITIMDLSEYQRESRRTAEYPREAWLAYPALGLAGEAGEVAEHAKKVIRDDDGKVSDERRAAMSKELGDVLWYVAQLASELDLSLDDVAKQNLEKLFSRQKRGVLSGSGDDR